MEANENAGAKEELRQKVIDVIKTCFDPEIPVNIYELGLIYGVDVNENNNVTIAMTLTSPHCPVAESLPLEVQQKVVMIEGVNDAKVEITWDPPWTPEKMSEAARLELNL